MEQAEIISKTRRKIIILILFFISIAFTCIGLVVYQIKSSRPTTEALDISKLVANNGLAEGQYVKIEFDTMPILMLSDRDDDSQLYFVKDINKHIYIVNMPNATYKRISETFNPNTGKLTPAYQLQGTVYHIDTGTKNITIGNSYRAYPGITLNSDNFSEYLDEFYIKGNPANERIINIYKCIVFFAFFLLILIAGYGIPHLINVNRGDFGIHSELFY